MLLSRHAQRIVAKRAMQVASVAVFLSSGGVICHAFSQQQEHPDATATVANASKFAAVEEYCSGIDNRADKRSPDFALALPIPSEDHATQWRKYAPTEAMEKAAQETDFEQQVLLWTEEGHVISATFTIQSESGDWALYPHYCFYRDARVAETTSELRTFYGRMHVRRSWKFSTAGELLKFNEEFLDLSTGNPKKPDDEFVDEETPQYKKVSDLPFFRLLFPG
jgi:hypothetical protein